ncbi:MAG TPA: hypothetical protein VIV11_38690 [Kofleriaceae bacterium]
MGRHAVACAAATLLAGGCGRIGFDARGDALDASAPDAAPLGPFGPPQIVPVVSSTMAEDDASMTGDQLEIYFMRGVVATDGAIYVATRATPSEMWGTPAIVSISNPTDSTARVSRDGLRLWVGSPRAGGFGTVDIWLATRSSRAAPWTIAHVPELSTSMEEFAASEFAGQTQLVFSSNRLGGSTDIFLAARPTATDPWGTAQPASLNTTAADQDAFVSDAGYELWFSSTRPGSQGGDLYYATRSSLTEDFGNITPVTELNTMSDENDPWVSPDGRTIIFGSNRSGNPEIYQAKR